MLQNLRRGSYHLTVSSARNPVWGLTVIPLPKHQFLKLGRDFSCKLCSFSTFPHCLLRIQLFRVCQVLLHFFVFVASVFFPLFFVLWSLYLFTILFNCYFTGIWARTKNFLFAFFLYLKAGVWIFAFISHALCFLNLVAVDTWRGEKDVCHTYTLSFLFICFVWVYLFILLSITCIAAHKIRAETGKALSMIMVAE